MTTSISAVLPLESGDRLSRQEFHHRYSLHPDIKKAELVQGVVYVASPARDDAHGAPHGDVMVWLGTYAGRTSGVRLSVESTIYLASESEVQPDALLYREPMDQTRLRRTALVALTAVLAACTAVLAAPSPAGGAAWLPRRSMSPCSRSVPPPSPVWWSCSSATSIAAWRVTHFQACRSWFR